MKKERTKSKAKQKYERLKRHKQTETGIKKEARNDSKSTEPHTQRNEKREEKKNNESNENDENKV